MVRSLLSFARQNGDVHETRIAGVGRTVGDRELCRGSTASPDFFSLSRTLLGPRIEVLPETGEESVRAAAEAELLAERYREKAVHGLMQKPAHAADKKRTMIDIQGCTMTLSASRRSMAR